MTAAQTNPVFVEEVVGVAAAVVVVIVVVVLRGICVSACARIESAEELGERNDEESETERDGDERRVGHCRWLEWHVDAEVVACESRLEWRHEVLQVEKHHEQCDQRDQVVDCLDKVDLIHFVLLDSIFYEKKTFFYNFLNFLFT